MLGFVKSIFTFFRILFIVLVKWLVPLVTLCMAHLDVLHIHIESFLGCPMFKRVRSWMEMLFNKISVIFANLHGMKLLRVPSWFALELAFSFLMGHDKCFEPCMLFAAGNVFGEMHFYHDFCVNSFWICGI